MGKKSQHNKDNTEIKLSYQKSTIRSVALVSGTWLIIFYCVDLWRGFRFARFSDDKVLGLPKA